jgi:hypothetical protein
MLGPIAFFGGAYLLVRYLQSRAAASTSPPVVGPPEPGGGGTTGVQPCTEVYNDGPYRICLKQSGGSWSWSANLKAEFRHAMPDAPTPVGGANLQLPSSDAALAAAWIELAKIPIGDRVVSAPIIRHGLTLASTGYVGLDSLAEYMAFAPLKIAELMTGLQAQNAAPPDALHVVMHTLLETLGRNANPLRMLVAGEPIQAPVQRVQLALDAAENSDDLARAVVRPLLP